MLTESQKEKLRTETVELLLAIREAYLQTPGVNILKHWEQLGNRALAAARTSATPEEWATQLQRRLQIPNMVSSGCSVLLELVHTVTELKAASAWLNLVEKEHGYIMAMARLNAEQRTEARRQARETVKEKASA